MLTLVREQHARVVDNLKSALDAGVHGLFRICGSEYGAAPYPITRGLIEDGRHHLRLSGSMPISCPVRLLHGMRDTDVPWRKSLAIAERLEAQDVQLTLIKDGDHRLSRDQDLDLLLRTVGRLSGTLRAPGDSPDDAA